MRGKRLPITEEWLIRVREAMAKRAWGDSDLARGVGVGRDTIGKMWKQSFSALVIPVSVALDISPSLMPTPTVTDEKTEKLLALISDAPDDLKDSLIAMLEAAFRRR